MLPGRRAAVKHGLHTHVRHHSPCLFNHITGEGTRCNQPKAVTYTAVHGLSTCPPLHPGCMPSFHTIFFRPPCLPAAFVQEWDDQVADATEAQQAQQVQQQGGKPGSPAAPGATISPSPPAGHNTASAAQEAVLSQNPFGFQHTQAPKVG